MRISRPEAGLVISYAYLWHREYQTGQEEGRKDRPAVIVLAISDDEETAPFVTVLPITHSLPADLRWAIEIPLSVKQHLGLDAERSWIIVDEGNEFLWPGYDLRKILHSDTYAYGFLPSRLFDQVVKTVVASHRADKQRLASRK